jgi:hypothetical protein
MRQSETTAHISAPILLIAKPVPSIMVAVMVVVLEQAQQQVMDLGEGFVWKQTH